MKNIFLTFLFATVSTSAFAYENNCTIGREGYDITVVVNDQAVEYTRDLNHAVESFKLLRDAGVCSQKKSNCTIGREGYDITVVVNNQVVEYTRDLNVAIASFSSLKNNGVCR